MSVWHEQPATSATMDDPSLRSQLCRRRDRHWDRQAPSGPLGICCHPLSPGDTDSHQSEPV